MNIVTNVETAKGKLVYTLFEYEQSYGIKVRSEIFGTPEEASVRDISTQRDFAETLLYALADNFVLPSTLREVVEDYIAAAFTV